MIPGSTEAVLHLYPTVKGDAGRCCVHGGRTPYVWYTNGRVGLLHEDFHENFEHDRHYSELEAFPFLECPIHKARRRHQHQQLRRPEVGEIVAIYAAALAAQPVRALYHR